jgi:hypothetical protein
MPARAPERGSPSGVLAYGDAMARTGHRSRDEMDDSDESLEIDVYSFRYDGGNDVLKRL